MPLYGPKWPLKKGNHDTYELYTDVKEQISFYLKNLLLTSPGENISDPQYGVGLRRYLFDNNVEQVRENISYQIRDQISKYLSFLTINDILVTATNDQIDNHTLNIKIIYVTPNSTTLEEFNISTSQEQEIGFY